MMRTEAGDSAVRPDAVVEAGEAERDVTVEFKRFLEKHGIHCPTVGVGSTPTCSAPPAHLDGVHEMHPVRASNWHPQACVHDGCTGPS